jgi:flagellar FliJ protein
MTRFKFALQQVLHDRERTENEKQQLFAERRCELTAAEDELARLKVEFDRYSTVVREEHAKLTGEDLRRYYAYLEHLNRCMTMQQPIIAKCHAALERARQDLLGASKDRKVLEKLKDRRFELHRAAEAAREEAELEDAQGGRTET